MHQRKTRLPFLISALLSLVALIFLIISFPPTLQVSLLHISFSLLVIFFLLLGIFLFTTGTYLFKSKKHGILFACFIVSYLVLRLNNLTHPFFFILLCALFLTLELLFNYRR
ncbi:MAG TPA: hypothetical protein VE090_04020 [Methylomirabilota bacterium]|nr:hypothetical protein [Methylomirabilota bacterium]